MEREWSGKMTAGDGGRPAAGEMAAVGRAELAIEGGKMIGEEEKKKKGAAPVELITGGGR